LGSTTVLEKLLLAESGFLVLLHQGAQTAAAGQSQILQAAAFEVVLLADVGALNPEWQEREADASGSADKKARGVDWLIALERTMLASTVMGLPERDAGQAPCDQAGVDGVEAAEQSSVPFPGISSGRSCNLIGVGESIIEASLPVIDIALIDWAGLGWCSSWR